MQNPGAPQSRNIMRMQMKEAPRSLGFKLLIIEGGTFVTVLVCRNFVA
jgi:hypothetical protein